MRRRWRTFDVFEQLAAAPLNRRRAAPRSWAWRTRPFDRAVDRAAGDAACWQLDANGRFELTPLAREHLVPGRAFDVSDYIGLAADSPGVRDMIERLSRTLPRGSQARRALAWASSIGDDLPVGDGSRRPRRGTSRWRWPAGRRTWRRCWPSARPLEGARLLLDVGGGTGIYSIACLQRQSRACGRSSGIGPRC